MSVKSAAALYLDTLPFNGHSTAAEALWDALPVLTLPGTRMAGRVAASLLMAVGLGRMLIARTSGEYENLAVRLVAGKRSERGEKGVKGMALVKMRNRMARDRGSSELWDTQRWCPHSDSHPDGLKLFFWCRAWAVDCFSAPCLGTGIDSSWS